MSIRIREFESDDFPQWLPLWDGNNLGHRDAELTTETWSRLLDPEVPVCGLGAFEGPNMTGLVHYILHPTTGNIQPICYMQDLYVDPGHRQKGIARKLVEDVAKIGKEEKWARMYWLAEAENEAAQALYKNLGVKLNFTLHVLKVA